VAAKEILAEDLPQLPLQVSAIHITLYILAIFKFFAIDNQYLIVYIPNNLHVIHNKDVKESRGAQATFAMVSSIPF
jgi:hypothetical protein